MARLPDLVQDSKLETHFLPGSRIETVHTYHESDPTSQQRLVTRSEHWQRQKKIGGGGFGSVWLEKCTKGGRRDIEVRAIKQIEIDRRSARIDYNRELEAIAKFSHWKYERCFVKSFGWYESPEQLFIAMEYLELGDLHTYLHRKPPLPEHEAREITYQILDGLCLMHDNEFAHRDLKPNNILLKACPPNGWWVKIADFGISKRVEDEHGNSTTLKGTLGYIAPELHRITKQGTPYAADIWAVGEIAFRMLTKQPTFKDLGLLVNYIKNPDTFPSNLLLAAQVSQLGVECIISLMHPTPIDRITAGKALHHKWMDKSLPYRRASAAPAYRKVHTASAIDLITEEFATWNTAPTTVIPRKTEEFGKFPLQTSSDETVRFQPVPNTSSSSSDGRLLESGSDDKTVRLWDPATGALKRTLKGHSDLVTAVAFSPDGQLLVSGSGDKTVRLWDPATGALKRTLKGHSDLVTAVAFSPDGQLLVSGSGDKTVRLWDPATGALKQTLKGHSDPVTAVAFSPDGQLLLSGYDDKTVRLWDPATGALKQKLKGHSDSVTAVAFSPDGQLLASGSVDKTVRLWDPATGALKRTLKGHSDWVNAVAFSPDGQLLVSGSDDETVRLWDPTTGALKQTLKGHSDWVNAVAFSPDGQLLASGSVDETVRLWDPATGALKRKLKGHSDSVTAVAFSPDGQLLASGSVDKTVRLWGPSM